MKCVVISEFYDKYNVARGYTPGEIVDWDDQARIDDCVRRGLVEVCAMEPPADPDPDNGNLARECLTEMKVSDLKKLAEDMGIDTRKLTKKAELIEAIMKVEVIPGAYAYKE